MIDTILNSFDIWSDAKGLKSQLRLKTVDNISLEGIENLRNLILGLSLSGKFTENKIKHSSTIKQNIAKAKTSYFKSIGKKPKDFGFGPPLLKEFVLPDSWFWMRIGELCDLQTGATPSTLKPDYYGGKIRWLVSGDINKGIIYDCDGRITDAGLKNSNCKILPTDTVLIALNGQGKTRASVALLKVEAACNQSLVGIIPFSSNILDSKFLMLSLHYRYYEIREITGQNQRRGLNMGLVNELSIPLPPLAEQHRIVTKVDELMALCDKLEEEQFINLKTHQVLVKTLLETLIQTSDANELQLAWERMSAHFDTVFCTDDSVDQLKQTILQLAVIGKLVKQTPNDEPASELLKRIEKERGVKRETSLSIIKDDEKTFVLPQGWEWIRLQQIIQISSGDGLISANMNANGNIPVFGGNGINGYHDKGNVLKPTLVIGRVGYYCGSIHITPSLAWVTDNAFITSFSEKNIYMNFLYWLLKGTNLKEKDSATAQPVISGRKVYPIVIALPPLSEQKRIVEKINELFTLCDILREKILKTQDIKILLSKTVVEKAIK